MDARFRLRRSLLYVPGNMPGMLQNIPVFEADGVMIDLEDAVPLAEKDAARILARNFLRTFGSRTREIFVRINGLDTRYALDDLREVLPAKPDGIRLPKADEPEVVERLDTLLTEYEEKLGPADWPLQDPAVDRKRAWACSIASQTARASRRIVALAFGAEDYTASMEIQRSRGGEELLGARMQVVWAAKAAGLQAIDSVFSDVNDMEGLRADTEAGEATGLHRASRLSIRGRSKWCTRCSGPSAEEIEHALEVMEAIKKAREMGTGVISLRGRMVDAPVVKRAARTIRTAVAFGMLEYELSDEVVHGQE